jgi:hypothetical protein
MTQYFREKCFNYVFCIIDSKKGEGPNHGNFIDFYSTSEVKFYLFNMCIMKSDCYLTLTMYSPDCFMFAPRVDA